jgi:protein-glutamine gamma-glutamyltransferase
MLTNNDYIEFERKLRQSICDAALALHNSGMRFAVFTNTECNTEYWNRTNNGGFSLKTGGTVTPANAIRDIFKNGRRYATECATAMMIVYYKAILDVYGDDLFNRIFNSIYLMDWDIRDPLLIKVGRMEKVGASGLIPGDRGYFANPDHDPALPQWQGENVIVLDNNMYYGHGIGFANANTIINSLNSRRRSGNARSAYLMDSAGRPDFKKLADAMYSGNTTSHLSRPVWREFPTAIPAMRAEAKNGTHHFCETRATGLPVA